MTQINCGELAGKVAAAMGADWTITPNEREDSWSHTTIHHIDDRHYAVWLSTTYGPQGMLHVAGHFERFQGSNGLAYGEKEPSINISLKKTPEQIAKDILKRLLPIYQPMYERAKECLASSKAYDTRKASLEAQWETVERAYRTAHPYVSGRPYIHGRVESDHSIKLEVSSIPLSTVKAILDLLN